MAATVCVRRPRAGWPWGRPLLHSHHLQAALVQRRAHLARPLHHARGVGRVARAVPALHERAVGVFGPACQAVAQAEVVPAEIVILLGLARQRANRESITILRDCVHPLAKRRASVVDVLQLPGQHVWVEYVHRHFPGSGLPKLPRRCFAIALVQHPSGMVLLVPAKRPAYLSCRVDARSYTVPACSTDQLML